MQTHIIVTRIPQAIKKVKKSSDSGSNAYFKTTEYGKKRLYYKLGSPFS